LDPLTSVFTNTGFQGAGTPLPFQTFGLMALGILAVMAATSHDFWLAQLTAPVWKALHVSVYFAYALLVVHVAWGAGQTEKGAVVLVATALGAIVLTGLHGVAARRERRTEGGEVETATDGVRVCSITEIPEGRAKVVSIGGERVAIFRHGGKLSAVSNVCQHQNGPLGEGRILHGCITCPWHGYQYLPETGASPPPFKEKVPVFAVRIRGQDVVVDPRPRPAGQRVAPAVLP
ncbi:MAG: Rieske 2Fe-2S domain-containing protein, partial [Opitutaceae bacterium]|nr:Rieske 2Fe-2S domain-containing protein [Opitutaceae bacterium]